MLTSLPHRNCQTCPLSAKSIPSKSTKLTPKDTKGQEAGSISRSQHSQQKSSTVGHGYNPSTLQAEAGDQECEESLTSYTEAEAKGVGWGWVARCLTTRLLTPLCREVHWDAEGRLPGFRQKVEAALRVVSTFLPKARSLESALQPSGLVMELPSLQKNTLL